MAARWVIAALFALQGLTVVHASDHVAHTAAEPCAICHCSADLITPNATAAATIPRAADARVRIAATHPGHAAPAASNRCPRGPPAVS